jgi:hypothetical protein
VRTEKKGARGGHRRLLCDFFAKAERGNRGKRSGGWHGVQLRGEGSGQAAAVGSRSPGALA